MTLRRLTCEEAPSRSELHRAYADAQLIEFDVIRAFKHAVANSGGPMRCAASRERARAPGASTSQVARHEHQRLAAVPENGRAVLVHHHGITWVGRDVSEAVMTAPLLERAGQLQVPADTGGEVQTRSPDDEAMAERATCRNDQQLLGGREYLVRRASRARDPRP